jgi:hypothetical protein
LRENKKQTIILNVNNEFNFDKKLNEVVKNDINKNSDVNNGTDSDIIKFK